MIERRTHSKVTVESEREAAVNRAAPLNRPLGFIESATYAHSRTVVRRPSSAGGPHVALDAQGQAGPDVMSARTAGVMDRRGRTVYLEAGHELAAER